jgi:hypothetical protein
MSQRPANDLRSISDVILKIYLYSIGAWGIGLAILYAFGELGMALTLCFFLSLWLGLLTAWWWFGTSKKQRDGELKRSEVGAGVTSIGRILAFGGMIPGIIFLANDPFAGASWGALAGVTAVTAAGWGVANLGPKLKAPFVHVTVLALTWSVLPLNATGTVTAAWLLGLFNTVADKVVG